MAQLDNIYSRFNQLVSWDQYLNLLIETLTLSGYTGLEDRLRNEFNESLFDNPALMVRYLAPLFSPGEAFTNRLYSGMTPLELLVAIDQSRNRVSNPAFGVDSDWVKGTGWAITGGVAVFTTTGSTSDLTQNIVGDPGIYSITYTITRTAGGLNPRLNSQNGAGKAAAGTYTDIFSITSALATLTFRANTTFAGSVDNVSLRQLA